MIALYIGGVKSGKSRAAEARAMQLSDHPVYLATSEPVDDEMQERIEHHKKQRMGVFEVIEEPKFIAEAVQAQKGTVLIECMTMWINNMYYYGYEDETILEAVDRLLEAQCNLVIVQNDVGSGVIAGDALSRSFVDLSGIVAQKIAARADEVYHCIAGIATRIK